MHSKDCDVVHVVSPVLSDCISGGCSLELVLV